MTEERLVLAELLEKAGDGDFLRAVAEALHSLETCDLLIPDRPIACTRSSTRRVDTPPIQASWITAISAFSELLRASRNGGK